MTIDTLDTKPSSAHVGPISDSAQQLVDPLSDYAQPWSVSKWVDRFMIWLNGFLTGQGFELMLRHKSYVQ